MDEMDHYDIVIVGGGAVGLSLLYSLSAFFKILVLESRKNIPVSQDRFIVLSNSSRKFYQNLALWQAIEPHCSAIESIEVSVQGEYGTSVLKTNNTLHPAMGYVISLHTLEAILSHTLDNRSLNIGIGARLTECYYQENTWKIEYIQNEMVKKVTAQCLIGADGQDSLVRIKNNIGLTKKSYNHQAIIGTVTTQGHAGQAFERLLAKGAIAFLPLADKRAVFIWTLPDNYAKAWFEKPDEALLNILQNEFGYRLGKLSDLQCKKIFPLNMTQADLQGKAYQKLLLMGTAALSLHPIGAQGLNLSLRNIQSFVNLIQMQLHHEASVNIEKLIQDYLEGVGSDQFQTQWMTDTLATYVAGGPFPKSIRALGVTLFDSLSPLKNAFTRMNMGLGVL